MPGEAGERGEAYWVGGGESCSEGGLWGSEGGGGSSSDASGVYCGCRGGSVGFGESIAAGGD